MACCHNQCCRALFIDAFNCQFDQLIGGQVGQILARHDAVLGQLVSQRFVHRLDFEQIVSGLVFLDSFLDRQGIGQQGITRTGAQFLDNVLIKAVNRKQLGGRHIGDFLDR